MKPLDLQDVLKMHRELFGVEPVITGIEFFNDTPLIERILNAIEAGTPYIEDEVPDGTLI